MKLYCRFCKAVIVRDARSRTFRMFTTKRGYKSYCNSAAKTTYLIPYHQKVKEK